MLTIILIVLGRDDIVKPICGKVENLLRHIIHCTHYTDETALISRAQTEYHARTSRTRGKENIPSASFHNISATASFSSSSSESLPIPSPASKRRRLDSEIIEGPSAGIFRGETEARKPWTYLQHEAFEQDLCRLFVACNIAWAAVEHPYFRDFFSRWLPHAILPGRKTLSTAILDKLVNEAEEEMRREVVAHYATGQCDGWKNTARQSLVASMINVNYTVSVLSDNNIDIF